MDITISVIPRDDVVEVRVAGRLDAEHAGELARAVDEQLHRGHHALALDLREVSFLSSAGIRILFEIQRGAQGVGGRCLIRAASEPVRKVLDLTRLTPLLMEPVAGASSAPPGTAAGPRAVDVTVGPVSLVGVEPPGPAPLQGRIVGHDDALLGRMTAVRRPLPRHSFAFGLAALAEDTPLAGRAGEFIAAAGTALHRPPQPFAAVDYVASAGDLVPEADVASGLVWHGLPGGRAGFEPAGDAVAVSLDDLVDAILTQCAADAIAVVAVGETRGLVGCELIRPLAEAAGDDVPRSPRRETAARWLCFSREPVHARRTALIVGVATRGAVTGPLAGFVRPFGTGSHGHFHAAVFPLRPLKRGPADLAATVADATASEPLAVMHLLNDPQPVFGSGRPELVRGAVWFAPLVVEPEAAR